MLDAWRWKKANPRLLESTGFQGSCNPNHSGPLFQFCMKGKDTGVSKTLLFPSLCTSGASISAWSQVSVAEEALGFWGNCWIHARWMAACGDAGEWERQEGGLREQGLFRPRDILTNLCRHQPFVIFPEFLREMGNFDLGTKELPFLLGEAREVPLLSSECFYFHWPPTESELGVD